MLKPSPFAALSVSLNWAVCVVQTNTVVAMTTREGVGGYKVVGDRSQDATAVTVNVDWLVGAAIGGLKLQPYNVEATVIVCTPSSVKVIECAEKLIVPPETGVIKLGVVALLSVSEQPHAGTWVVTEEPVIVHNKAESPIVQNLLYVGLRAIIVKDVTMQASILIVNVAVY